MFALLRRVLILFALVSVVALWVTECPEAATQSVTLCKRSVFGAVAYVITVDLNDPSLHVSIGLPARGIPASESFWKMVNRHAPLAAVTGTYFDTRTLYPVGSIVTGGNRLFEGAIGTVVCFFRPGGMSCVEVSSVRSTDVVQPYVVRFIPTRKGDRFDWTGIDCGLRTGPKLLSQGMYVLDPRREGFKSPGLFGDRTRMALGLTAHNKLLLVSVRTPVTFGKCAAIMKALGAREAACLDGGSSSAMYYRGKLVLRPGRALTNILMVKKVDRPTPPLVARVVDAVGEMISAVRNEWPACPSLIVRRPWSVPLFPSPHPNEYAVMSSSPLVFRPCPRSPYRLPS